MIGWLVGFPLLGFLVNGLWYAFGQMSKGQKAASAKITGVIGSFFIFLSFILSLILFFNLQQLPESSRFIEQTLFSWMQFQGFNLDFAFRVDALSSLFLLVITGVGTLIHVYSIGYMSHDEAPGKYFAYLNLFCASMLTLVLGASLPITFLGWEGVGLCSYLLIGFWYVDDEKASAGKKAFIVNRIGDLGFLIGVFILFSLFGTLSYTGIEQSVSQLSFLGMTDHIQWWISAACLALFVGCTGKSAQIPLYVWLPDAMAGPTPVSALIHAATMVTSGVYLVSRLGFLFLLSPIAMEVMAWVGALTAFFAATIAIVQTDIKKVLAYSTVSQLGYMFLACGVGAFSTGVFHVITHAFFKALLFLGAGSVIHGLHEEQNIEKMGGLKSQMPQTFLVFVVGWLAICGIPPFSGFFSKDEVLWKAFSTEFGSSWLWVIGALAAIMTAFYMTRLVVLTFFGEFRGSQKAHESPSVMVYPLYGLAALSLLGGFIGIPHFSWLEHWLSPLVPAAAHNESVAHSVEWGLMALSVAGAALGIFVAFKTYQNLDRAVQLKSRWAKLHELLFNKWYIDELYQAVIVKPLVVLSTWIWKVVDVQILDRIVMTFGRASAWAGQTVRVIQTGSLQMYGVMLVLGILITVGYLYYGIF